MQVSDLKVAVTKAAIVLVPSYTAAWVTDKMVFVVPTLAAAGFFASSIDLSVGTTRRVDEDGTSQEDSGPEETDEVGQAPEAGNSFGTGDTQFDVDAGPAATVQGDGN